ncbi:amidohydrolase family protein [soil metagenome]
MRDRPELGATLAAAAGVHPVLLRGGTIVSMDPSIGILEAGDLLIEDGTIAAVGGQLPASDGTIVVDVAGAIIMPGFVDGHRHSWQGSLRRLAPDADLPQYMAITHDGVARHYRPEDMYAGNLVALLGALDNGFTTVLDFSHNSRSRAHADAVFAAYREVGIRAVHASAPPNAGEWEEHWPDDLGRLAAICAEEPLITLRLAIDMRRIRPVPELIEYGRRIGLGITMDGVMGAASSAEIAELGRAGHLGPDITLIHATSLGDDAWREIERWSVNVVMATTSDEQLGLAGGVPPVQRAIDAGLRPALSVDVEIALAGDMFTQMRATLLTQRMFATMARVSGAASPVPLTNAEVLEFATLGGAEASGLGHSIGSLTVGKAADILIVSADEINNLPGGNPIATIVQGSDRSNIRAVFVGGILRKWDGALLDVDIERVRDLALASREHLLAAAGIRLGVDGLEGFGTLEDATLQSYLGNMA